MRRALAAALFVIAAASSLGCMRFHQGALPGEPPKARFATVAGARIHFTDTGPSVPPEITPVEVPAAEPTAGTDADGRDAPPGEAPPASRTPAADVMSNADQDERDRPTVVLVHGFASSLDIWTKVARSLASTHRVISLDLKGFGWSDRPPGDYSPEAQARVVLGLLDHLGVSRAAFVGHSWGSSVVLSAAMQAPARVTRIALYDAWIYDEQLPAFFHWSKAPGVGETLFGLFYDERTDDRMSLAFFDPAQVTEKRIEDVTERQARPGNTAAALAAVRGQNYADVQERYRTIQMPTLLLWGRDDRITPLRFGERLAGELPNARIVVYPRCGHFPMIEAAEASGRELAKFLTETSS